MSSDPYSTPESGDVFGVTKQKSMGCLWPTMIIIGIVLLLLFLLLPGWSRRGVRPARRTQCKNNLKQIGLALYNYHDVYGAFPPAAIVDVKGRKLHSWRTLILPYMDQQKLYDSIDLSKSWDDPANASAYQSRPNAYSCPAAGIPDTHTTYMALVGDDHFLREMQPRMIREITGGTSNTAAVMEVPVTWATHWMEPADMAVDFVAGMQQQQNVAHEGGVNVLLGDGAVRFMGLTIATDVAKQLMSVSESVTAEW